MFHSIHNFIAFKNSSDKSSYEKIVRETLGVSKNGKPNETNGHLLYIAWKSLSDFPEDMGNELMYERFYKDSTLRYETMIQPHMKLIQGSTFSMGFHPKEVFRYIGELPLHSVKLTSYFVSSITITNKIYSLYDSNYKYNNADTLPVTNVSWYDAVMFGHWVGCTLPSEAQWEYACRAGSKGSWCCDTEEELRNYGWSSENSQGNLHPVAQLQSNKFGLYDMHGNVWEWCADDYSSDFYSESPLQDPINTQQHTEKVCRGGSYHAFPTMCRSGLRYSEPAYYFSPDTGFRVAKQLED